MPKKTVFLSGFVRTKRTRKRFFSCVLSHVLFQLRFGCGPIRADTASYGFLPCMNAHAMQLQITLHLWFVRAKATFKSFYSSFSDECVRDWRWVRFGFSWLDLQDRKIKLILSFIIKKVHRKFFLLQRTSRKGKKSELKIRKITELSSLPHCVGFGEPIACQRGAISHPVSTYSPSIIWLTSGRVSDHRKTPKTPLKSNPTYAVVGV